jgi:hypothetical protein
LAYFYLQPNAVFFSGIPAFNRKPAVSFDVSHIVKIEKNRNDGGVGEVRV